MPSEPGDTAPRYAYLDSSAIVKLVVAEPETAALEAELLNRDGLVTSRLGATEVRRAARRTNSRRILQQVDDVLAAFAVVEMVPGMFDDAATLGPPGLRTLDALHVAAAATLDLPGLDFITYDDRLAKAAASQGLAVVAPR